MTILNTNQLLEGAYIITMQTETDKTLYLMMTDNGKLVWTFEKEEVCVWEDKDVCKKFGDKWFKNFDSWVIREYTSMEVEN